MAPPRACRCSPCTSCSFPAPRFRCTSSSLATAACSPTASPATIASGSCRPAPTASAPDAGRDRCTWRRCGRRRQLPDGRSNIVVLGERALHAAPVLRTIPRPYLVALVRPFEDDRQPTRDDRADQLARGCFVGYRSALRRLDDTEPTSAELPARRRRRLSFQSRRCSSSTSGQAAAARRALDRAPRRRAAEPPARALTREVEARAEVRERAQANGKAAALDTDVLHES